jgi:hypothetical protein
MANVQFNLPGLPQDLPPNLLRYLSGVDTLLRGLQSFSNGTDAIASQLASRPQAQRYLFRTLSFADVSLSSPPATPDDGAIYFVNGTGSGDWSGYDNQVVLYASGAWEALGELEPGQLAWDQATETMYRASNDGTIAALEQSAQSIVNSIQADATALADLNTTVRQTSDWVAIGAPSAFGILTFPAGWTSAIYYFVGTIDAAVRTLNGTATGDVTLSGSSFGQGRALWLRTS